MRVGIVGLGTSGTTLACLLHDAGHEVTVLEQAADPRPVGAGIWLQALGQRVLDRLGLLEPLRAVSRDVDRVAIHTASGRRLVDLGFDALPGATPALGVHRGALFTILHTAVRERGIAVRTGVVVTGARPTPSGIAVETAAGDLGTFDLLVGADGSRSPVRRSMNVTTRDHSYEYGALWTIVEDAGADRHRVDGTLYQCLSGTSDYLGVLPTGRTGASMFWSVKASGMARVLEAGLDAWRETAAPLAGPYAPLLDRVEELLPAGYRDVVVRTPVRVEGRYGAALVGDSAHAMSPQLGTGTSLALADVWSLAHALATHSRLAEALPAYARERAAHLRWYQWTTRLMMPVFQSDLAPLAWPRDALAPWVARAIPRTLIGTLCGDRTSPWTSWPLPGLDPV
ncbi:FAD-dependent oxidoreductase [Nocardioides sp. GXZ039]|uniref:FAD-dependent oxidoreductase n=1 Tax=Nocardioides sp. GXZ039 TaxID=3136018 RepID=UPI0030F3C2F9